jgi:hypothetical protein
MSASSKRAFAAVSAGEQSSDSVLLMLPVALSVDLVATEATFSL